MKRPILYWVVLFILGELLCKLISTDWIGLIGSGMLLIYVISNIWLQRLRRQNRLLYFVGGIFLILGVFCMYSWEHIIETCSEKTGQAVEFQGIVQKKEEANEKTKYFIKTSEVDGKRITAYFQIELLNEMNLTLGSTMAGRGDIKPFSKGTNPGDFDEENYQYGKGIMLAVKNVTVSRICTPKFPWREYLHSLQTYFADIYSQLFNEINASLATAMVLGEKSNLDTEIEALYQRNGIAHLIAISGLHIAMIGGMLYKLLRKWIGSYPIAAAVGVIFIVAYGVMTGLSSATLRAIIMLITSIGADVFGRRYDALTAISLALFLMLVQNPYQITQVGFLLSFGAIIGIAFIQPVWKMWFPNIPGWSDGFFVSVSVQLILMPIMFYYFYEIPVYSIFLNVIVVPIMNVLLVFLLLCAITGGISVNIALLFAKPADIIFAVYETLCEWNEQLPGHTLCTGRPEIWWIVCYYLILGAGVWFVYQNNRKTSGFFAVAFMLMFVVFFLPSELMVCMFDVGQGDGIYIRTPGRQHILVDGGSSSEKKVGTYTLKNGLKYYGGNVLDYVFVSHSDSDHYSGIVELLAEETIHIRNFVLPAITNPDAAYVELEEMAREKGCRIYYIKRGDVLQVDGVTFRCLNPMKREYDDKNTGSIVLQMTYDDFDMLLTGDIDQTGEKAILQELKGRVEVLKVAHHGSATSSSEIFLQNLRPEIAVVSVGEKNSYGHPADEVMERLAVYAQKIYLTKDSGAITIETDGEVYEVSAYIRNR